MCSGANMTMDNAVQNLGKVPIGLRRYISTVLVLPSNETHAYTLTNGDIHVFGLLEVDAWVHEVLNQQLFSRPRASHTIRLLVWACVRLGFWHSPLGLQRMASGAPK